MHHQLGMVAPKVEKAAEGVLGKSHQFTVALPPLGFSDALRRLADQ